MPDKLPNDHHPDESRSRETVPELVERLRHEIDERERLRIGRRIARLDADHPVFDDFGERRFLLWCTVQPVVGPRLRPGLTARDPWVRRSVAETLLDAQIETEAVTACLLDELQQATVPSTLYDDRHHEIHDAAWGLQFEWLRMQWPWFVRGLLRLEVACPEAWLDDPCVTIRLNACRLLAPDDRIFPILRPCLDEYSWLRSSFWTFIAACELLSHLGRAAEHALPELNAVLAQAPPQSLPRRLAEAVVSHIR